VRAGFVLCWASPLRLGNFAAFLADRTKNGWMNCSNCQHVNTLDRYSHSFVSSVARAPPASLFPFLR
jgi:hypothetical protein